MTGILTARWLRFVAAIAFSLVAYAAGARADQAMEDIWEGVEGGTPSITANPEGGVSITLPPSIAATLTPEAIARLAKAFLDRWAPGMCSEVFDFQSPHKQLHIEVRVMDSVVQPAPGEGVREPCPSHVFRDVTIDYEPSRKVTCVVPGLVTS